MVDVSPSSHPSSTPDFRLYPVDADAKYTQSPSAATPAFYAFYAFYTPPPPHYYCHLADFPSSPIMNY